MKMIFLNLILIYLHVSIYSDCEMQDLLTFCIHYDIFHEYKKQIESNIQYRGTDFKKYIKNYNVEEELKKLL